MLNGTSSIGSRMAASFAIYLPSGSRMAASGLPTSSIWHQLACRAGASWHVEVAKRRAALSELVVSDANWQDLTTKWDLQPC
jgi:hypothetical protein